MICTLYTLSRHDVRHVKREAAKTHEMWCIKVVLDLVVLSSVCTGMLRKKGTITQSPLSYCKIENDNFFAI